MQLWNNKATRKRKSAYYQDQSVKSVNLDRADIKWYLHVWIFQFLGHKIQVIPSRVGKYAGIKGHSNLTKLGIRILKKVLEIFRVS